MNLETVRTEYQRDRASYVLLVEKAKEILEPALRQAGVVSHVEERVKTVASLVRKVIRKKFDDGLDTREVLSNIRDKAGIRIIVDHLEDAKRASQAVSKVFSAGEFEDTAKRYKPYELGYLGRHAQAKLRTDDLSPDEAFLEQLEFEVQIHTKAQNAWSSVSHPLLYKPPGDDPPDDVASKVYRSVALVSLFDEQIDEARARMATHPIYRPASMLDSLHRIFIDWLVEEPDDQLSLEVLNVVANAYDESELNRFDALISSVATANREALTLIFSNYAEASAEYPLLFQPEVLAIYERLKNAKAKLRVAWLASPLSFELLDELATIFATPFS